MTLVQKLFAAARRQTLEELVGPALRAGRDVVCERFHPSTYAYQGVAGDLDAEEVRDPSPPIRGRFRCSSTTADGMTAQIDHFLIRVPRGR